jgi:hypothetical protein
MTINTTGTVQLGAQATTTTHAVRADRTISTSGIATGGGNLTANRTINVPATNLSWTNGTTAGPTVNSSTGTNAVIPTASTSISGVVTTGNQSWAGTKTTTRTDGTSSLRSPDFRDRGNTTYRIRAANTGTAGSRVRGIRVDHLGVGTSSTGTTGQIRATGNITAFSSDRRLKNNLVNIQSPLEKVGKLNGVHFTWDLEECNRWNFFPPQQDTGLIAQEVQEVLPDAVKPAPFDAKYKGGSKSGKNYLTVQYEKVVPLLVESIKELKDLINKQNKKIEELEKNVRL